MREILFRGKRVDNGEWVNGYFIKANHHWHEHGVHEDWIAVDTIQNGGWCNVRCKYAVIPETIGQYAGLTDKNGTKIFEGDIITAEIYEREYEDEYLSNTPIQVTYCSGYFYPFHLEGCWRSGVSNITVIGNTYDNPELLKESDNDE